MFIRLATDYNIYFSWRLTSCFSMGSGCVAQLVERSLPIPEVRGSNPVVGKNLIILNIYFLSPVYWKDENKEKEAGDGPFKINILNYGDAHQKRPFNKLCKINVGLKYASSTLKGTLGLVISCCSHQTACWRPAFGWLGWISLRNGVPNKSH